MNIKKLKLKKGFTLIELLAVIVILAIILVIAIPSVLSTLTSAKQSTFREFVTKAYTASVSQYLSDTLNQGYSDQCIIYNVEEDIGLSSTGDFHGYVLVNISGEPEYWVSIYSSEYGLALYKYGDDIDTVELKKISELDINSDLSPDNLASTAECGTYISISGTICTPVTTTSSTSTSSTAEEETTKKTESTTPTIAYNENIIAAYTYNQKSGADNYCVTGDESTCVTTTCYKTGTSGSCPAGTIIDYKVNSSTTVRFHVVADMGSYLKLQSQQNTTGTTAWGPSICSSNASYTEFGPLVAMETLKKVTSSWTNVVTYSYNIMDEVSDGNEFLSNSSAVINARMITYSEAKSVGCSTITKSCPIWMYNYLSSSVEAGGGTVNSSDNVQFYWTQTSENSNNTYVIQNLGELFSLPSPATGTSAVRALVYVNKTK